MLSMSLCLFQFLPAKACANVTSQELPLLLKVLTSLRLLSGEAGVQHIVDLLSDVADLESTIEVRVVHF